MTDDEFNKVEHERMSGDIAAIERELPALQERWFAWCEAQDAKWETFKESFLSRLETIRGAVDRKDEVLGAMLTNIKMITERLLSVQGDLKEANLPKLKADVDEAHERWRELAPKVEDIGKVLPTFWTRNQQDKANEKKGISAREWILGASLVVVTIAGTLVAVFK